MPIRNECNFPLGGQQYSQGLNSPDLTAPRLASSRLMAPLLLIALVSWAGCSGAPARIHPASVDQSAATEWTFEHCDQDKDGGISKEEALGVPAIERRFSMYDKDKDGKVTPEEFKARLTDIFDPRAALVGAMCQVTLGGRPLEGATVQLVPEEFLAEVIPPAEGVTNERGLAELEMAPEDVPAGVVSSGGLLRPGIYRVIITHPTKDIPAKYNHATTLGEEVSRDTIMGGPFRFALSKN